MLLPYFPVRKRTLRVVFPFPDYAQEVRSMTQYENELKTIFLKRVKNAIDAGDLVTLRALNISPEVVCGVKGMSDADIERFVQLNPNVITIQIHADLIEGMISLTERGASKEQLSEFAERWWASRHEPQGSGHH